MTIPILKTGSYTAKVAIPGQSPHAFPRVVLSLLCVRFFQMSYTSSINWRRLGGIPALREIVHNAARHLGIANLQLAKSL